MMREAEANTEDAVGSMPASGMIILFSMEIMGTRAANVISEARSERREIMGEGNGDNFG